MADINEIMAICLPVYIVLMDTKGLAIKHISRRTLVLLNTTDDKDMITEILHSEGLAKVNKLRKRLQEYDNENRGL